MQWKGDLVMIKVKLATRICEQWWKIHRRKVRKSNVQLEGELRNGEMNEEREGELIC